MRKIHPASLLAILTIYSLSLGAFLVWYKHTPRTLTPTLFPSSPPPLHVHWSRLRLTGGREVPIAIHDPQRDWIISGSVVRHGLWEPEIWGSIATILFQHKEQQQWTCVDVGANIGVFSLLMLHYNQACAQVHSFEPAARNMALLQQSHRVQNASTSARWHLHYTALGEKQRKSIYMRQVNADGGNWGNHQTALTDNEEGGVGMITLDALDLPGPVLLLKVDVEGDEVNVLWRGGHRWIERTQPLHILVEWGRIHSADPNGALETLRWLTGPELGYRMFHMNGRIEIAKRVWNRGAWNPPENIWLRRAP